MLFSIEWRDALWDKFRTGARPREGETPSAPVLIDGQQAAKLKGADIAAEFQGMAAECLERRFGR